MNFNDEPVYVGRDFGGRELTLDRGLVESYSGALGDSHPLYTECCPGLLLHSECYENLNWYLKNIFGNLHARQEWELFDAVPVGSHVSTRGFIRERYQKRGREYVVKETWVLGANGRLLNRGITHQSFLVEGPGAQPGSGKAVVGKEREKKPGREFDIGGDGGGAILEGSPKHVNEAMCMAFSGPGENYHTDRESARALGFPDIVVQGMMPICFLSELLTREFGRGWLAGGKTDLRLVNVLWCGETVRARAQLTGQTAEPIANVSILTSGSRRTTVPRLSSGAPAPCTNERGEPGAASALRGASSCAACVRQLPGPRNRPIGLRGRKYYHVPDHAHRWRPESPRHTATIDRLGPDGETTCSDRGWPSSRRGRSNGWHEGASPFP